MVPVLGFLLYLSRHKYVSTGVCFHNQSYSANGSKPGGTFDPVIRSSGESNLEIKVMLLVLVTDVLRTWGEVIICIKLLDSGYDFCSGCQHPPLLPSTILFQDSSPRQSDYVISQTMVTIIYSLFSQKLW